MKNRILTTTALTLFVALPAFAATDAASPTVGERLDHSVAVTQQAVSDAVEKVRDMMADKDNTGAYGTVAVNLKTTAAGVIGQDVYNVRNEKVAKVEDIIVDASGKATQMILTNGGFLGMGAKLVAVDFSRVYVRTGNDDVIVPISEETIKSMLPFSYEMHDAKEGMRSIPVGSFSMKAMMDGDLFDGRGAKVAAVDNITLNGGHANQVIVTYGTVLGDTLGMNGGKLAVAYDKLQKMRHDSEVNFKMSDELSARFEAFTKATK